MPHIITVLFPRPSEGKPNFNMDHYFNVHIPLAAKTFTPLGMQSITVVDYIEDETQPYFIANIMEWESVEAFEREQGGPAVQSVFADLANITDITPIFLNGKVTKTWRREDSN
ncbi:hypothetical protein BX600DRAFT_510150 [Xylariales sp. PMI_506]|nr:hypothetical protein BX600DRAFT_510150 [Xylariales sp. PMI_506]